MTYHVPFSAFRQQFPRSFDKGRAEELYVDCLLAVLAKDPSYRWSSKTALNISCRTEGASRAFTMAEVTKQAVFQFGRLINRDLVLSW